MDEQTSFFETYPVGVELVTIDEVWGDMAPAAAAAQEPAQQLPPITAIAKLTLQPGDSLVVFVVGRISCQQAADLRSYVQQQLDTDVPVLVLELGMDIGVLSTPAAETPEPASGARTLHGALVEASGDLQLGGRGAVE